jgi:hypothetical protein
LIDKAAARLCGSNFPHHQHGTHAIAVPFVPERAR